MEAMSGNCKRRSMTHPSSCLQDFQRRKLRYAEGLKRHLVDSNGPTGQYDEDRTCQPSTSKRRRVSVLDDCSRRFGTSIPPDANRLESAQSCQEYNECSEESASRTKNLQSNSCSRCSKTFSTRVQLQKHATTHHVTYKCPLCTQTLSGLSLLKVHVNSVHM